MKALLLGAALAVLSEAIAFANPPPELAKHLEEPGNVLAVYPLLSDSDLKHIIIAQHGPFFVIAYARWENPVWKFSNDEVLEIIIAIDKRPHVLWSRDPPT